MTPQQLQPEYRATWTAADGSTAASDASLELGWAQSQAADHRGTVEVNYGQGWGVYAPIPAPAVADPAPVAAPEPEGAPAAGTEGTQPV